MSFTGRFEPREYTTSSREKRVALEVHDVTIEYGPKPRTSEHLERTAEPPPEMAEQDIPF